ncbi:TetR/AcrR family transcriptional regulator [Erwinia sp. Leaf53]|uniref:TetR/AcrR family transcriptional regulator n=1 Tax=Erwinia sp. Leaf53 TaxID=1736225 RepID=UPI000701190C|nr:TetR/AcrR family transcriptional regulator [Erwinia sp. Leaf53]KQN55497.1 TetR family transcriptional regulator [Erwinia sp. Leaf53]
MAGRPREFDREQALITARDLFWRHGYEGTSLADLVAALGIASARIYKAFGSKEQLYREAIGHYEQHEGGFATRALQHPQILSAVRQMLEQAVLLYTVSDPPAGCMVVSAAGGLSEENQPLATWLAQQRKERTAEIVARLQQAQADGQLRAEAAVPPLGEYYATVLHGLSVQARDGASRERLNAAITLAMLPLQNLLID